MSDDPRVSTQELKEDMDRGEQIVVVDVRRGSWDKSDEKIAGAVRIDPERLEDDWEQIPAGSNVVAYCT